MPGVGVCEGDRNKGGGKREEGEGDRGRRRREESICRADQLTTGSGVMAFKHKRVQLSSNLLVSHPHPLVILGDQYEIQTSQFHPSIQGQSDWSLWSETIPCMHPKM